MFSIVGLMLWLFEMPITNSEYIVILFEKQLNIKIYTSIRMFVFILIFNNHWNTNLKLVT